MLLLSLIFAQDLLKLSNSSTAKKWEATSAKNVVIRCILTSDDTESANYGLIVRIKDETSATADTTTKPQKNDRKLQIFSTKSRLLITALLPNFSD